LEKKLKVIPMTRVIGIDLGTTYSCASYYDTNKKEIIVVPNPNGNVLTPSIVYFESEEYTIVGDQAEQTQRSSTSQKIRDSIVQESKCHMGSDKTYTSKDYTPRDIASFILRYIKSYSEDFAKETFSKVVITVPAYFDDNQRKQTMQAALDAGFEKVVKIINEPTAAALAYGFKSEEKESSTILVIDIGGGTTDFSIVEMDYTFDVYQVLNTNGDTKLGGKDFTDALVDYVERQLEKKYPELHRELGKSQYRLDKARSKVRGECEKVKKRLTYNETTVFQIEAYYNDRDVELNVTRAQFNNVVKPLLDKLVGLLGTIISESKDEIKKVLFIGGCTRIPEIKRVVSEFFGGRVEILDKIDPDTTVAIGAGIQAYTLDDTIGETELMPTLLDIVPLSIGIRLDGGIFGPIVNRGELLPAHQVMEFRTSQDYTSTLDIHIYQGERRFCKDNLYLGSFTLEGVSEAMRHQIIITIDLKVDTSGQLTVEAYEKKRDTETKRTITLKATTEERLVSSTLISSAEAYRFLDMVQSKKLEVKIQLYDKFAELLEIFQDREDVLLEENKDAHEKSYKAWRFNTLFNNTWSVIENFQDYSVVELEGYLKDFKKSFYEALFEISEYDLNPDQTVFSSEV
jgi:molecular chaperone DnaK (HSP70)